MALSTLFHLLRCKVPTFDAMPMASTTIFNMSMYNNENDTKILNEIFSDMYHRVQGASPTQFHRVLEAIAEEGRLHRLYTQNIDGLDTKLAALKNAFEVDFAPSKFTFLRFVPSRNEKLEFLIANFSCLFRSPFIVKALSIPVAFMFSNRMDDTGCPVCQRPFS